MKCPKCNTFTRGYYDDCDCPPRRSEGLSPLVESYNEGVKDAYKKIIARARARADKSDPSGKASEWLELRWFANELEAEDG